MTTVTTDYSKEAADMAKDSFIFHLDFIDEELLTAEEIGLLTIAAIHYAQERTIPEFEDRALMLVWRNIQKRLDADFEAYEEKCRMNSENGKKGGRPKKTEESERFSEKTEKTERFFEKAKKADIDIDIDTDIDIDSKKEGAKAPKKAQKRFIPPTLEEVKEYCEQRKNGIDAQRFIDYYASQKWKKANGQPLTDWKAGVRTWEAKNKEKARSGTKVNAFNAFEQRQNNYDEIEARMLQRRVAK